jgi:hypothetical protein
MSPRKLATVLLPSRTRQGLTQEELPKGPTSRGLHRRPRDWRQLGTKDPGECIGKAYQAIASEEHGDLCPRSP